MNINALIAIMAGCAGILFVVDAMRSDRDPQCQHGTRIGRYCRHCAASHAEQRTTDMLERVSHAIRRVQ